MPKGYTHLTHDERCQINTLSSIGFSKAKIAQTLKRAESTIAREIQRNSGERGYRYQQANGKAIERRSTASSAASIKLTAEIMSYIKEGLQQGWSPEQISGRLKYEKKVTISKQTIYAYIKKDKKNGGNLHTYLRHSKPYASKGRGKKAGRGCIPNRRDIEERPKVVDKKTRIGDWEGDTVIGAKHQGVLTTLVDRKSKYTLIGKVPNKSAEEVNKKIVELVKDLEKKSANQNGNKGARENHTITFDNGKEFSRHEALSDELGVKCYFARPYHSWERGLNEHTNGLIRQYIPKKTNIHNVTEKFVDQVAEALNNRPRKSLNYKTPAEVYFSQKTTFFFC